MSDVSTVVSASNDGIRTSDSPGVAPVRRIERTSLVLLGVALLASLFTWQPRFVLGVALGGGLATLNFWALRRLIGALLVEGQTRRRQGVMGLLLALKFGILGASLFLIIRFVPVHPIGLLVGVSTLVLAIFIVGLRGGLAHPE